MKKKSSRKSSSPPLPRRAPQAGPRALLEPVCLALPELLRERRVKLGLSLKELARRSRLSHQAVSLVERAKRVPGLDTLARLGHALELFPWQLVREAERRARVAR